MTLYFDTAYIAKCYLNEPGGKGVRKLARKSTGLASSVWCVTELSCVFHRHVREVALTPSEAAAQFRFFLSDVRKGVWSLLPLSERLLHEAAQTVLRLPASLFLRGGDAVHLVTARDAGFTEIWSNDRHLLAAASHFGLEGKAV